MSSSASVADQDAWAELAAHPWWRYRACAPAETDPAVCAADEATPRSVFHGPDMEPQPARLAREAAARRVCAGCPMLAACRTYALGPEDVGRPREREGIWGGMTGAERRAARRPAPRAAAVERLTEQRQAVLDALAAHTGEAAVALAAGTDVRTANWHRSRLATLLGLDHETTTRCGLLTTAWQRGLLGADVTIVPDGDRPVAAVPCMQPRVATRRRLGAPRRVPAMPGQLTLPPAADAGQQLEMAA